MAAAAGYTTDKCPGKIIQVTVDVPRTKGIVNWRNTRFPRTRKKKCKNCTFSIFFLFKMTLENPAAHSRGSPEVVVRRTCRPESGISP